MQDLVINKKKPSKFKTKCKFPKQEVMSLLSQDLAKKVGPNLKHTSILHSWRDEHREKDGFINMEFWISKIHVAGLVLLLYFRVGKKKP